MGKLKYQLGFIPLIILIAIGVVVVAGGTYIVRNQFVKIGKSGKAALDTEKIQKQLQSPSLYQV